MIIKGLNFTFRCDDCGIGSEDKTCIIIQCGKSRTPKICPLDGQKCNWVFLVREDIDKIKEMSKIDDYMKPSSILFFRSWIMAIIAAIIVAYLTEDIVIAVIMYFGIYISSYLWEISEKILDGD